MLLPHKGAVAYFPPLFFTPSTSSPVNRVTTSKSKPKGTSGAHLVISITHTVSLRASFILEWHLPSPLIEYLGQHRIEAGSMACRHNHPRLRSLLVLAPQKPFFFFAPVTACMIAYVEVQRSILFLTAFIN